MQSQLKLLLIVAASTGGLGFLAGRVTAPSDDAAVLGALETQRARLDEISARLATLDPGQCAPSAASVDPVALRAEVARAVREELAARPGPRDAGTHEEPRREPPSPANLAAAQSAFQLIESAVQAREWGEPQAQEFRKLLGEMNDEQRAELMRRLAATLNRGEIRVTTQGPPF